MWAFNPRHAHSRLDPTDFLADDDLNTTGSEACGKARSSAQACMHAFEIKSTSPNTEAGAGLSARTFVKFAVYFSFARVRD